MTQDIDRASCGLGRMIFYETAVLLILMCFVKILFVINLLGVSLMGEEALVQSRGADVLV